MFTGLIEAQGSIQFVEPTAGATRIRVAGPTPLVARLHTGDSVAVSGVCLTALEIQGSTFAADLAAETLARTSLAQLHPGSIVNLELPTPAGTPLGGHIVQGHVDGTGVLASLDPVAPHADPAATDWWLRVSLPADLARYVVEKGSIAIEGISLTVARVEGSVVTVALIPHTYAATNLRTLAPGSPVNVEVDVLAKYAERRAAADPNAEFQLTVEYLVANGY